MTLSIKNTPLHYACINEDLAMAERLIRGGANIHAVSVHGQKPLECFEKGNGGPNVMWTHAFERMWRSCLLSLASALR